MRMGSLLAASAVIGLLAMPDAALAQQSGGAFMVDNVLWLPEVFAQLSASKQQSVQAERQSEAAIFKKVERALKKNNFSKLTRAELASILSISNRERDDRDLSVFDAPNTAYAGLDRMVGVQLGSGTSFKVDLSANLLPTMLVPTVSGGEATDWTPLDEVYSISNVLRGKGGAKIAKNGIQFDPDTGELTVTLKKPFGPRQFVNLLLELDDGSGAAKSKKKGKAPSNPTIQVMFANMPLPSISEEPIVIQTANATEIESKFTEPHFVVHTEGAGLNLQTGVIGGTSFTAFVTNGVLFNKFDVEVASPS